jgi:exonuclease SbcC
MRINKLKFKNLNSLKGEFEIDFTNRELIEDNIFAIIGDTGSGKSTILDAITLALFGKTARIDKITGSSNEIMNRDSGNCYSEVIFSTNNKEYSALFSQRKARDNKNGNLVMYKRELRDYQIQKVIASNKTFDEELMNLINLTFDQFSRSVLLAQGDFNKFLIAKDDDKAKILEQITGTEIYSSIGKKIYEHYSAEKKNLDILDAKMGSQNVLSDEEKKQILEDIEENEKKIVELSTLRAKNQIDISYYDTMRALEKKKLSLSQEIEEREKKLPEFNECNRRIDRSNSSVKPIQLLDAIEKSELEITSLERSRMLSLKDLETLKTRAKTFEEQLANKIDEISAKIDLQKSLKELAVEVRPLDKKISDISVELRNDINNVKNSEINMSEIKADIERLSIEISSIDSSIEDANTYLMTHSSDKQLVDNFSDIVSNNISLSKQSDDLQSFKEELKTERAKLADYKAELEVLNSNIKENSTSLNALEENKKKYESIDILNEELENLNFKNGKLEKLSLTLSNFISDSTRLDTKNLEFKKLDEKYAADRVEYDKMNELYEISKKSYERGRKLLKLTDFANQVVDDEPCPLCGSIDHPSPISIEKEDVDEEERKLNALKVALDGKRDTLSQEYSQLEVLKSSMHSLNSSCLENRSILEHALNCTDNFKTNFAKVKDTIQNKLKEVKEHLSIVSNIERDIERLKSRSENLEINKANTLQYIETSTKKIVDLNDKMSRCESQLAEIDEFFEEFEVFKHKDNRSLDRIKSDYLQKQRISESKLIEKDGLEKQISSKKIELTSEEDSFKKFELIAQKNEKNLKQLQKSRYDLFEDKDLDVEASELSDSIQELSLKRDNLTDRINENDKNISSKETQLEILKERIVSIQNDVAELSQSLDESLKTNGFKTADEAIAAKLDEEEYDALVNFVEEFKKLGQTIDAIKNDIKKDEELLEENKPVCSYDDVMRAKEELDDQYDVLQQTKGNLRQRIDNDSEIADKLGALKKDREIQYKVTDNWAKLNTAVGSSDGKKFRGLAQGITLDYLLNNSNRKLSSLTDRYSLVRSPQSNGTNLDIDVVDLYMNGITRSVNNLSGGEKFLVSLSLALGLCELVNADNPSETLFLDEGFGTLDEETLDNALNTLMLLSERENKLIGIISHVQKVKDAISHKIIVEKNGNGSSVILGPGVS